MSRRLLLVLVIALGLVQLAVPAWQIVGDERVLREGETWRFEIAPRDPADPFRGRYLWLGFAHDEAPVPEGVPLESAPWLYVPLIAGEDGFAELGPVAVGPPADGAYLRVRNRWPYSLTNPDEDRKVRVDLPFDRFYLEESSALRAEEMFLQWWRDDETAPPTAWAVVRVLDGRAVLEDVMVDGRPIREVVGGVDGDAEP